MTELPEALPVPPSADELRERSLELLEFPRVREALAEHTRTPMSRDRALGLTPSHDGAAVAQLQQETAEAALAIEGGAADLTLSRDPRPLLQRSAVQGVLAGDELIAVADALDLVRRAKALGGSERGRTPLLRALARNIADFRPLEREIRAKLTPLGELKDDASPMLRQLRRESRDAYQSATGGIQAVIESDAALEALQDRLFTVRGDRLVVPIKADFKGRIPGIVHAVSDSGATLFIEPLANVPRTNRWREAEAAEREEELRVLRALSASVSRRAGEALRALEIAGRLDAALAKARYARSYEGVTLAEHAESVELVGARHPLLPGAVPVSLALRPPQSMLVVTGPNTGGKTVALKTLGLLALMRQSGMMLPCEPSTRLPLFDAVYADIGDQQSIERAVSTFSSHVTAIIGMLEHATPRSLVLLDELGASTDPEEGSALAKAVARRLADIGAPTVATTHHRSLAAVADEDERVGNASVELHPVTLRPTYKLTMGLPGRSYAMEIASRLGLDPGVVAAAQGYLDPRHREMEGLLAAMQQERHMAREKLDEAEAQRAEASRLASELERRIEELEAAQAAVVEQVRAELLAEAKRVRAKLRQAESAADWQAFRDAPPPARVLEQAADDVAEAQRALRAKSFGRDEASPRRKARLRVGESVEIGSLGFMGVVLTEADGSDRVEVQVGSARLKLEASRLRRAGEPAPAPEGRTSVSLARSSEGSPASEEIDLRGERAHDALEKLDQRLDAALAQGLSNVRIVHGKGTGALRRAVWRHLASNASVASYALAPRERGGDGATEVVLT